MVSTELILVITTIGYVLILPWTFKIAGNWDKVKKWYDFLIAGILIGFGAFGFRVFSYATGNLITGQLIFFALELIFQTVACVLSAIGLIGMAKELVFKGKK